MYGKIIRSLAGFYDVYAGGALYRCRARGVFRALGVKPLVGDDVEITVTDTVSDPMEGSVDKLLPRKNKLLRPSACNLDQAMLVFAVTAPAPSINMLDRFLISVKETELPVILTFTKTDLASGEDLDRLRSIYRESGVTLAFVTSDDPGSYGEIWEMLKGKTTVFAGPSGVGKSTMINYFCPEAHMETGEISRKIERGKNTTRHVELFWAGEDTYIMDTPGFTSLYLEEITPDTLRDYYPEFEPYEEKCRFHGCMHESEPGCAVRAAAENGEFSPVRYDTYREILRELKERRPAYPKSRQ
ncbi:MAG: ribosome small subunit-dependent GTPase A [Lachnospiraceae bacterium]|nr:ribosome small subunit-dependent GTPase A [Lachnospiraceae bacterium]